MLDKIDYRLILASIPILIPSVLKLFLNLVNSSGMIEVQKFLSSRERRFFSKVNELIKMSGLIIALIGYLLFVFYSFRTYYTLLHNDYFILPLILINSFLLLSIWLLGSICIPSRSQTTRITAKQNRFKTVIKIRTIIAMVFKKAYPTLGSATLILGFVSIPTLGAIYIFNLVEQNLLSLQKTALEVATVLFFACFLFIFIYELYLWHIRTYTEVKNKIIELKTRQGKVFNNLYLYSHDDKNLFLGLEPDYSNSSQHLIVSKDTIEYFTIEIETYKWDKKLSTINANVNFNIPPYMVRKH